jgi:hypothetical protein
MTEEAMPVKPCALAEQLLPEYWQEELNADNRAWLERHLESCADCTELAVFWRDLGQLPDAKPDPLQSRRFDAMLAAYQEDRRRRSLREAWADWLHPWPIALALLLMLASFGAGWLAHGNSRPTAQNPAGEIAALRQEVEATSQLAVLSMLREESANDRLEGVSYSRHLSQPDPKILQALLRSLQYDPSPDVRLAALGALQNAGSLPQNEPEITRGLVEAFKHQSSPLLQVALVDSFLELHPPAARSLLSKISTDAAYSPEVRQRAAWGLSHWN